jgi:hypothetical protein
VENNPQLALEIKTDDASAEESAVRLGCGFYRTKEIVGFDRLATTILH